MGSALALGNVQGGDVNKTLGIILIVLGLVGLAYGGFTYRTREKIIDVGPIQATQEKTHSVPVPPIAGAVALIGGIVLLARKEA
jgi:membrane-bound ClpP family serine protease